MNADEYKRLAAAEATIASIRTALGAQPDDDLVSLAAAMGGRCRAAEAEVAWLAAWAVAACKRDHSLFPPPGVEIDHKVHVSP